MSPALKVVIIINNYLHDVATAMLLSSALVLWLLARAADAGSVAEKGLVAAYPKLRIIARASIVWIVLGGIPRTIYFQQVEWNLADPSNKYLYAGLIVKHVLMWVAVIVGATMWARIGRRLNAQDEGRG